jgi:hypothetical protein
MWRDGLGWAANMRGVQLRLAAHLCGELSREAMSGDDAWWFACSLGYQRVQLNGFSGFRLPMLRCAQRHPGAEWILQTQTDDSLAGAKELAALHGNVSALWDKSGGRGEIIDRFPCIDGLAMGYAGGLSPDNLLERIAHIKQNTRAQWIDLESGVRTDGRFDLAKVRRVLELAKPFMEAA